MFMPDIIIKKKNGDKLTAEEISFFVNGYVEGKIPDYQVSALLMAICFQGMDKEETSILTDCMMHSGDVIDLSSIPGVKVDKHSTGGVGDKTSLVLGPMVAACGAKVAKLSGRGLGHTGGTIDKLEAIPGFQTQIPIEDFIKQVSDIGLAIVGQTANLVPADKKLYALRDVTGTVNSIPLIASSIMSKKLATGSDAICLDVKYGSGAFCTTPEDARVLAKAMVEIGNHMGRNTKALITNMDEPLGLAIGNSLEVIEAINTLRGEGPEDLRELCLRAGAIMLVQAKLYADTDSARKVLIERLNDGSAFNKLVEFVTAQHGDASYIIDPKKFQTARNIIPVISNATGFVQKINTILLGDVNVKLGAGREKKEDSIDFAAGIVVNKKTGDYVTKGDVLAYIHTNHTDYQAQVEEVLSAYFIETKDPTILPLIYSIVE